VSSKPETTFIKSVNRHIADVYAEKMNNPFRSGTADVWYSGGKGDLWLEYKFVPAAPKRADLLADLSERQKLWLAGRLQEGRNVAVIVGCPSGGVLMLDRTWEVPITAEKFNAELQSREALAAWIRSITGASPCLSRELFSPPPASSRPRTVSLRPRSSSAC
jgi:hypothetical protein